MGFTIKTTVKLFMLFLFFQVALNFMIEFIPDIKPNFTTEDAEYLQFLTTETNAELDGEGEANTLLENFQSSIETENYFNDSIIDTFLGTLQIIGSMLKFLFALILQILFTPTVIIEILLYNFIASSSILFQISLIVNVYFYVTLFYIVFKSRTKG